MSTFFFFFFLTWMGECSPRVRADILMGFPVNDSNQERLGCRRLIIACTDFYL